MSKQVIWGIVVLMSVALIGIIGLQSFWIKSTLDSSNEQFDKSVRYVLNKVSGKLEQVDDDATMSMALNEDFVGLTEGEVQDTTYKFMREDTRTILSEDGLSEHLSKAEDLHYFNQTCSCENCLAERMMRRQKRKIAERYYDNNLSLSERIQVGFLDTLIKRELRSIGLILDFEYGVYSLQKLDFIIRDGQYMILQDNPNITPVSLEENSNIKVDPLLRSTYEQQIFKKLPIDPGFLKIYFPGRTGYVWSTVMWTFLSGLLFTGIILFCFIYTVREIIRQKKLSKIKSDFINNMTHEFKTPIATISLAADSITSPMIIDKKDRIERFAGIIKQENRRMNSQVEKVLQMALLDKKDFQLKYTDLDMNQIITNAVRNINLQVEQKGGEASAFLNAEKVTIQGDLTHISNVVNNLLDNANKYTPESPIITVTTKDMPNGIQISVKDNGIGMNKEARKHIFDKFYRVHTGNLHDVKGFGLGLSYVKAIMTAHKGQIDVKSELGKGSEFVLFLPHRQDI